MSNNELTVLENKVNAMLELEAAAKDLQKKADEIKEYIKSSMTENNETQVVTQTHVIRFRKVLTTRFDKKRFVQDLGEDAYLYYSTQIASMRFNID